MENVNNLDKLMFVHVTKDRLEAYLSFSEFPESLAITKEDVMRVIDQAGITYGIDDNKIDEICQNPILFVNKEILIAKGKAPVEGEKAKIEYRFQKDNRKVVKEREDGTVDFFNVDNVSNVVAGQLLAVKIPRTFGTDGIDVYGNPISAKPGKDIKVKLGQNVYYDQEKESIYAKVAGQVSVTDDGRINVFDVFEVKGNLDLSVGNIDFVGNVVIRGDVPSGFKVRAKGDITIGGLVESAEVIAGGSITIAKGINMGIAEDKKGIVKAGGNIHVPFIMNANVEADGDVLFSKYIMHSNVTAGGKVEIVSNRGIIIGGVTQANTYVKARSIGNMTETKTTIEVGANPYIVNKYKSLQKEIGALKATIDKVMKALNVIDQLEKRMGTLPDDKTKLKSQLLTTKMISENQVAELQEEMEGLKEKLTDYRTSYVEVIEEIFPGTTIKIGPLKETITRNIRNTRFYIYDKVITNG